MNKAVILAGGKATRMGELTKTLPKALLPVKGKPIIEHQLELLEKQGFKEHKKREPGQIHVEKF